VQIRKIAILCHSAQKAVLLGPSALFVPSVSMLGHLLTPIAVLAGVMGVWRFGADPGWTRKFFLADGLFSRYQLWFAVAIAAQTSALILNRWVANQNTDQRRLPRTRSPGLEARQVELKVPRPNREAIAADS
jgi:hypothetical protein